MKEILDGLLLGDGYLQLRGTTTKANPRFGYNCKPLAFTEWVSKAFDNSCLRLGPIHTKPNGYGTGVTHQVMSNASPALKPFWDRWYPLGKKVMPEGLALTPRIANLWYCGDGGFDVSRGYLRQISIAVHCYEQASVDSLVSQLRDIGLKISNRRNMIYISKKSIPTFLEWIGPPPCDCYQYKWDHSLYTASQIKY